LSYILKNRTRIFADKADIYGFFYSFDFILISTSTSWSWSSKTNQFQLVGIKIRF